MRDQRLSRRQAFTLVELLVVIGIIAVLIAILLPAVNGARRQARLVQCTSIIRSLVQATEVNVQAHGGYMPLAGNLVADPSAFGSGGYPGGLGDPDMRRYAYAESPGTAVKHTVVPLPAAMAEHLGVRDLPGEWKALDNALNSRQGVWRYFMCPDSDAEHKPKLNSDPNDTNWQGQGTMLVAAVGNSPVIAWATNSDYGFNEGVLGYHYDRRYARNRLGGKLSAVRNPSEVALFTDALPRKTAAVYFFPMGWICWTPALTATGPVTLGDALAANGRAEGVDSFDLNRHKKRINIGFVDGHVATYPIDKAALDTVYLVAP